MTIDRRRLLFGSLTGAAVVGVDAAQFGVRAGAADDQTAKLQRVTSDLAKDDNKNSAARYPQLTIANNQVR